MKLKQGLAVAVAALAVYALPVSGAFAATPKADQTIELHYCVNLPGEAGDCAAAVVPAAEWEQADAAINSCLERVPTWTVADIEGCIAKWDPTAAVTRSHIDAAGTTSYRRLKQRHHAKSRHHRTGNTARASRN